MKKILFFGFFIPWFLYSQQNENEQLAREYFQQGQYEKAIPYYAKIIQNSSSLIIYQEYLTCLIKTERWKEAEKLVQTQKKKSPLTVRFYADELELYFLQNNSSQFNKKLKQDMDQFMKSETMLSDFVSILLEKNLVDAALLVAQEGAKTYPTSISILTQLAKLYEIKGEAEKAISTLFDLFDQNPQFSESTLKEYLLDLLMKDREAKIAKAIQSVLLSRIQKKPSEDSYVSLLIWFYLQQEQYKEALTQAKAVDRRTKNDGKYSLECAETFYALKKYDLANEALQYVLSHGEKGNYYQEAYELMLQVTFDKLLQETNPPKEEIENLRNKIFSAFQQSYKADNRFALLEKLITLDGYFLRKTSSLIDLLQKEIANPLYTPLQRGKLKIRLADIEAIDGDPWEAALLYSQVEKDFNNDSLGSYAKFCKARLFYFLGEIDYAQGQLDILRGATSKTIANDAMELSLRIQLSIDYDSSYIPLQKLAKAEWLLFGWKYDEAKLVLDTIINNFPDHPVQEYAMLLLAQLNEKNKNYDQAIELYQKIKEKGSMYADDAIYYLAKLYDVKLNKPEETKKYYEELIFHYPSSFYVNEILPRYRELRGDKIQP